MNHVASGLDLQPGDEVLTTNHEHGGGMVCWQHLARTRGVVVRCIKMPNPVRDAAQILQLVEDHLTPRTRVCSFCHIDTITGLQMPLTAIAALTRPRDILLVCDGAQAPGMLNVDVKSLGVDTYASSSHKWMLAPKGTGLLYIRKDVQDRIRPVFTYSGYNAYSASSGTRNVPQIVAHGVAMEFHNTIGRPRIEARCRQLSAYARQRLAEIPQLTPITPSQRELSSGIVSFSLTSGSHSEVVSALQKRDIFLKPAQGTYAYVEDAGRAKGKLQRHPHLHAHLQRRDRHRPRRRGVTASSRLVRDARDPGTGTHSSVRTPSHICAHLRPSADTCHRERNRGPIRINRCEQSQSRRLKLVWILLWAGATKH